MLPRLNLRIHGVLRELEGEQVYASRELDGITGEWVVAVYGFGSDRGAHSCYLRFPEGQSLGVHDIRSDKGLRAGCFLGNRSHFSTEYGGRGELILLRHDELWLEGRFAFTAGRLAPPYDLVTVREGYFRAPVR